MRTQIELKTRQDLDLALQSRHPWACRSVGEVFQTNFKCAFCSTRIGCINCPVRDNSLYFCCTEFRDWSCATTYNDMMRETARVILSILLNSIKAYEEKKGGAK